MTYWWNVKVSLMDFVKLPVPSSIGALSHTHTYVDPVILLVSAIAFSVYYVKVRGLRKLVKAFFLLWFVCTVITSLFTLLSLIGLTPIHLHPGTELIVNMFSFSFAASLLNLSNVFGLLELLIDVTPKFLIANGTTTPAGLEVSSFILSVSIVLAGMVLFVVVD